MHLFALLLTCQLVFVTAGFLTYCGAVLPMLAEPRTSLKYDAAYSTAADW